MQTIPESYTQAGFHMKLFRRERNAVIYRSASKSYWEVHQVRIAKAGKVFGKAYPEREILAGNEDFGSYAWACPSEERAEARLQEILSRQEASVTGTSEAGITPS